MKKNNALNTNAIDRIFWFFLFIFTDPGGLIQEYVFDYSKGYHKLISFTILTLCYLIIKKKSNQNTINKYIKLILIWFIYYFFVFGIINNEMHMYRFFASHFIHTFMNITISIYVYYFIQRSANLFTNTLINFSIIIFFSFCYGFSLGLNYCPY